MERAVAGRRAVTSGLPLRFALLLAAAVSGCGPSPTTQPTTQSVPAEPVVGDYDVSSDPAPIRTHIVGPYDTLYKLSIRYYGEGKQWRKIFYANRNRINDPDNLPVGMRLIIPPS
jgi:nucleoid-associated protein YgaU